MRRKYLLNECVFDDLNNEDACYWLGVITADGWVSGNTLGLEVSIRDYEWLELLKEFLSYTGPIYVYGPSKSGKGGGNRCRISVCSPKIVDRLCNLGIDNHKTTTANFCNKLPMNNICHYIRGITDGDGHITYKKKGKTFEWGITGTKRLLVGIKEHLKNKFEDINLYLGKHGNIFRLTSTSNYGTFIILDYLYSHSQYSLERKKKLAELVSSHSFKYSKYKSYRNVSALNLKEFYDIYGSWAAVARHLGVDRSQLWKMRVSRGMSVDKSCKFISQNITKETIHTLYSKLGTWKKVAEELGISERHLFRIRNNLCSAGSQ